MNNKPGEQRNNQNRPNNQSTNGQQRNNNNQNRHAKATHKTVAIKQIQTIKTAIPKQ